MPGPKGDSWAFGHVVAVVEFACGVAAGAVLVAAGAAGRSPLDGLAPFLLALVVGGGLVAASVRSWRAAGRTAPSPRPAPPPTAEAEHHRAATPPLSPEGERELARIVVALDAAGVFAPRPPDPVLLAEGVADAGEPVDVGTVLAAVGEIGDHHPGVDPDDHLGNLVLHDSHVEQFPEVLRSQAADLVRLAGGGPDGTTVAVEIAPPDAVGALPTTLRIAVHGREQELRYAGAAKYLSTVLHVTLARALHERGTGRRLAALWTDQGVWLAGLADGAVERLAVDLGPDATERWGWLDEEEPHAAGEIHRR